MRIVEIEGIKLHVSKEGLIQWASDWTQLNKLAKAGHLRYVDGGPGTYNHTSLYLVEPKP